MDGRLFVLAKAGSSKTYCDEMAGVAKRHGVGIAELSPHLQGQLIVVNPGYDDASARRAEGGLRSKGPRMPFRAFSPALGVNRHTGTGAIERGGVPPRSV